MYNCTCIFFTVRIAAREGMNCIFCCRVINCIFFSCDIFSYERLVNTVIVFYLCRSLQKLEQWDKIVKKINDLVTGFQLDTGDLCELHRISQAYCIYKHKFSCQGDEYRCMCSSMIVLVSPHRNACLPSSQSEVFCPIGTSSPRNIQALSVHTAFISFAFA